MLYIYMCVCIIPTIALRKILVGSAWRTDLEGQKNSSDYGEEPSEISSNHTRTRILCIYIWYHIYINISYIFITYTCMEHTWMSPFKWRNSHNRLGFPGNALVIGKALLGLGCVRVLCGQGFKRFFEIVRDPCLQKSRVALGGVISMGKIG